MRKIETAIEKIQNGEIEEGLSTLEDALIDADDNTAFDIAQVFVEMGQVGKADEILMELLAKQPNNSDFMLLKAELEIEDDNEGESIHLLSNIQEADENYLSAQMLLADLYQAQGLEEAAEHRLKKVYSMAPDNPVLAYALAEFYRSVGRAGQAIPFYKKAIHADELENEDVSLKLADVLSMTGAFEEALIYFKKGLEERTTLDGLFGYGVTAYQAGKYQTAITALEQLRDLDEQYSTLYPVLASAYQEEGAEQEALEAIETGINKDEHNERLYLQAAETANRAGADDKAEKFYEKVLTLNPTHEKALIDLGELLYYKGDFQSVISLASRFNIEAPRLTWLTARALSEEDEVDEAIKKYELVNKNFLDDPEFQREYGELLWETGKRDTALNHLKQALAINPDDQDLLLFVERIEQDF